MSRPRTVRIVGAALFAAFTLSLWLSTDAQARDVRTGAVLTEVVSQTTPASTLDLPGVPLGPANVVLASGQAPVSIVATASSTAQVFVNVPQGALPEGATLSAAPIASEAALQQAAPPLTGMSIIVGFQINARTSSGAAITRELPPVKAVFTVPASLLSPGTNGDDLVVAYWTGTTWVTLAATVAENVNANGSVTLTTNLPYFAVFSVQARAGSALGFSGGTIAASGVSIVSFTGTTAQLSAAGAASKVVTVTTAVGGKSLTFVVGAPDFANAEFKAAFPSGLSGTLMVVKV